MPSSKGTALRPFPGKESFRLTGMTPKATPNGSTGSGKENFCNWRSVTYASRNGVPVEIVSKVILRHQDLKTAQAYLGRVTESEAIRWMDVLHER